jgi:ribose transport system substrate-binding protein
MKKTLAFLMMLVLCLSSLAACAPAPAAEPTAEAQKTETTEAAAAPADETKTIAWLLLGANDWTVQYQAAAKKACEEAGFAYVEYNCEGDVQKQLDHVQTCISAGVTAIAIQPAENAALAPALKKAADAGIIVINHFEMDPALGMNDYNNVYFVVYGQYLAGQTIGNAMAEKLPQGSKVGLIGGSAGADNNNQRKQGFKDAVAGKLEVVSEIDANWDRAKAQTAAEDMMTQFPDLAGIYAVDDGMAMGVVAAVKGMGKESVIAIAGTGGDANGISMLKANEIFATCTVGCDWYATQAVEVISKVLKGETVDKKSDFTPEIVTPENVADFE